MNREFEKVADSASFGKHNEYILPPYSFTLVEILRVLSSTAAWYCRT